MNRYNQSIDKYSPTGHHYFWLLLFGLFTSGSIWGECPGGHHNIDFGIHCNDTTLAWECSFGLSDSPLPGPDEIQEIIGVEGLQGSDTIESWGFAIVDGAGSSCNDNSPQNLCQLGSGTDQPSCLGITIGTSDASGNTLPLSGTVTGNIGDQGCFQLTATKTGGEACHRNYWFHITGNAGGWGDPHITTVDGKHYDFQSAGEFVALRGGGVEIQARQTPISTNHVPGENAYTKLASCVSIYTAVAARVGDHRVTIQPNISGKPDPDGLQIRVDGKLKKVGPDGIDLSSVECPSCRKKTEGRIVRSPDDDGRSIEVHYANGIGTDRYANGTRLVVTPAWWQSQKKWYLNIHVYNTAATEGIMGRTKDKWLPALSDGTTLGPFPEDRHERYIQLYETFADSWRVGNDTIVSLFDYRKGTSTEDFTLVDWPKPRGNPLNCLLEDRTAPVAKPVKDDVARKFCSRLENKRNRENCVFDVRETGEIGFARAYQRSERINATQVSPGKAKKIEDKKQVKRYNRDL